MSYSPRGCLEPDSPLAVPRRPGLRPPGALFLAALLFSGYSAAMAEKSLNVPFYPSRAHITKNWAPETSLSPDDVRAMARAQVWAERSGALSPELARNLPYMMMVEGRSGNHGVVRDSSNAVWASPANVALFEKMGLSVTADQDGGDMLRTQIPGKKGWFLQPNPSKESNPDISARLAAAYLAQKAAVGKGKGKTDDEIVKSYNGEGRALEHLGYGEYQQADANNHIRKVREARGLWTDPKNNEIRSLYESDVAARAAPAQEPGMWDSLIDKAKNALWRPEPEEADNWKSTW